MTTNKVYYAPGTAVTFSESDGDVVFKLDDDVAAGDGKASAQWDRGAGAKPGLYTWEFHCKWVATPTLGDVCRLYLYASEGAATGDEVASADVTPETKFDNFKLLGQCICPEAADQLFYASGMVFILGRYVNLGVWNASATKALNATANACRVILKPFPADIQAAT